MNIENHTGPLSVHGIVIVFGLVFLPMLSYASPCSEFQWHYPSSMVEPEGFQDAKEAMRQGNLTEARQYFLTYLKDQPEGVLAEGAHFALASLSVEEDAPDKRAFNTIDRLQARYREDPQSAYAPWALCRVGELYEVAGWSTEANGIFEEFLTTYPEHPLTGGVLLNAGLSYLESKQYIEAALIFRRLVQEPQWERYQLEGALGLANATAFSHAWDQAFYWYQVVDVEQPQLIRSSAASTYHYGLTESKIGDSLTAVKWFLTTYNLHPHKIEAGYALNHIGEYLLKQHRDMAALWFFQEAALRYTQEEPGRRGEAALTRWVFRYLASEHSKDEWRLLYDRLDALDIYLSVSWNGVIESSRVLAQSPESDLADEAQFWLANGYQEIEDNESAMNAYSQLALSGQHDPWKKHAQDILETMLLEEFRDYARHQKWVKLLRSYEKRQLLLTLLPQNLEWMQMVAEAYRHIGLPRQALQWYDKILKQDPPQTHKEEILSNYVVLAQILNDQEKTREAAVAYIKAYPKGKWNDRVSLILGDLEVREQRFKESLEHFTSVLERGHEKAFKHDARRKRAKAYYELAQYDRAIDDYRQLVHDQSAELGDRLSLADLLYEQKRYAEAEALYQVIADSEPLVEAKTWAQFRLALCFQQTGKQAAATKLLDGIRQPGQEVKDLEVTIRAAAAAVIDEFILTKGAS